MSVQCICASRAASIASALSSLEGEATDVERRIASAVAPVLQSCSQGGHKPKAQSATTLHTALQGTLPNRMAYVAMPQ